MRKFNLALVAMLVSLAFAAVPVQRAFGASAHPAVPAAPQVVRGLCGTPSREGFQIIIGARGHMCIERYGNFRNPGIGTLLAFDNRNGNEVWFYQYANGKGWKDCFSPTSAWTLLGRDRDPGRITSSHTTALCIYNNHAGNKSRLDCGSPLPPFYAWATSASGDKCWNMENAKFSGKINLRYLDNGTGGPLWLYQRKNHTGWADCFPYGYSYYVAGTRDANPGSLVEHPDTGKRC
jgi:hypothetical protein